MHGNVLDHNYYAKVAQRIRRMFLRRGGAGIPRAYIKARVISKAAMPKKPAVDTIKEFDEIMHALCRTGDLVARNEADRQDGKGRPRLVYYPTRQLFGESMARLMTEQAERPDRPASTAAQNLIRDLLRKP